MKEPIEMRMRILMKMMKITLLSDDNGDGAGRDDEADDVLMRKVMRMRRMMMMD